MVKSRILVPIVAAAALAGCSAGFYRPSHVVYRDPADLGLKFEAVSFPSGDGTKLTGIFLFASTAPVRGTIVQFHGNGENMTSSFGFLSWLTAYGFNAFVFDYRGYGASEGSPSQTGVVEDGAAALRYVRGRRDVDPARVAVWGQSLGGAVAVASIVRDGDPRLKALILESTFNSYRDMAQDVLSRSWLTWPLSWPLSRLLISDRESPERVAGRLPRCPILVVAGTKDRVVPERVTRKLYDELQGPKDFWEIPGADHLDAFGRLGAVYRPRLAAFLESAFSE